MSSLSLHSTCARRSCLQELVSILGASLSVREEHGSRTPACWALDPKIGEHASCFHAPELEKGGRQMYPQSTAEVTTSPYDSIQTHSDNVRIQRLLERSRKGVSQQSETTFPGITPPLACYFMLIPHKSQKIQIIDLCL